MSDGQWRTFCAAFEDLADLGQNADYALNNQRVLARDVILPRVRALFGSFDRAALVARLEALGLPFAPIARPDELFDDPHLNAAGGLVGVTLPGAGTPTRLPALPIELDGERLGLRHDIPDVDADRDEILRSLGIDPEEAA